MMRLSYHLLITPKVINRISQWQTVCQDWGFDVRFDTELPAQGFSDKNTVLRLDYKSRAAEMNVYTSPASDVTDICDELPQYISEEQNLAVNFDFDGKQEAIYGVTVAVLGLTKLLEGILYIEGDGQIVTAAQALENARAIDADL
jgi:hypothetical protein